MSEHIIVVVANNIFEIRINRPDRKNAMTGAMYTAIATALEEAQQRDDVRVVLFRGGDGVFCAGNDIQDFIGSPPVRSDAPVWQFFNALMTLDKPIVVAVDGSAIGVGTTMLLHCELVYASDRSFFALPFASLGLTPEGASTILLPLLAGRQKATEMLMLGKKLNAEEAKAYGIVTEVVDSATLLKTARDSALALAALDPDIIRQTKRLLQDGIELLVSRQYVAERDALARNVEGPAAQAAFKRFLNRSGSRESSTKA